MGKRRINEWSWVGQTENPIFSQIQNPPDHPILNPEGANHQDSRLNEEIHKDSSKGV